jgi:DNA-binding NarL/FixJ family response regulator
MSMGNAPIHILLIEDNPGDAALLRRMLRSSETPAFEIHHASTFSDGMDRLQSGGIDVLLLDLGLPGTSGFETIANALAVAPDIPIIVLSGADSSPTILECIKAGAKDYFVKSRIDRDRLIEVLRQEAKKSGSTGELNH